MPVNTTIKIRKGTESEWSSSNPVLASGEPGFVTDTSRFKIGDGNTSWNSLNYSAIVPSGFIAGSGVSIETGTNGLYLIINSSGLNTEQVDDRVSQLLVEGTGVNLTYNDASGSLTIDNLHTEINILAEEPQGFVNRADSAISFNDSSRTFTIQPAVSGGEYDIYVKGIKVAKTGVETVVVGTGTALNFLHFSTTAPYQLQTKTTFFDFVDDVPIAYIHWNSSINQSTFFGEERHGIRMDTATHKWIHNTFGMQYINGLSISYSGLQLNGSLDSHAQISLSDGVLYQEDIIINVTNDNGSNSGTDFIQPLNPIAYTPVYYHLGTTGQWVRDSGIAFPLKYNGTGPLYNLYSPGPPPNWTTPNVSDNRYFAMWLVATNDINDPILAIMGQRQDSSLGSAENNNIWSDINLTNIPVFEFKPLYRLIFQADNAYTNTPKATLQSVLDLRASIITTVAGVTQNDHGSLFGLGDDDHNQYVHIDTARTITAIHTFNNGLVSNGLISSTSGNFGSLSVNGTGVSISGHTHTASSITDFNEAVDDRIGSGLFSAGTGINLNYNDGGNSFTVSVTGLIANPTTNRILTSRDSTTTGIDAESDMTFNQGYLNIGGINNENPAVIDLYNSNSLDQSSRLSLVSSSGNYMLSVESNDDTDSNYIYSDFYPLYIYSIGGPLTLYSQTTLDISAPSGTSVSNGNFSITNQTANTIAGFDSSKNVTSLSTGTYPSLTELSYVKGVTSGIQTQLGNKANNSVTITAGSGLVGGGDLSANRTLDIGQGDGITVSTDSIAVNSTVVRTTGTQTISGTHTFSSAIVFGSNVTVSGNLAMSNQTASTIAGFDASKNVSSLSTATYPSLTELSYVKGVTSAIQTQINAKQNTLTNPVTGTGAANHIAYWTSSSGIAHDANQLFWDATNNRLGINTSAPSGSLNVIGTGLFSTTTGIAPNALLDLYSATSGDMIFNVEGTNGSLFSVIDNLSGTLMSVNNNAGLPVFEVFSNDRVVAGRYNQNDLVVSSGGNIGIGTSSPAFKLDVLGSGSFKNSGSYGIQISPDISTNTHKIFFNGSNTNGTIEADESAEIFKISSTVPLYISNDSVSIYISAPGSDIVMDGSTLLWNNDPLYRPKSLTTFTPLDNQPPASNFATLDTRNSIAVLDFDDTTEESAVFVGCISDSFIDFGSGIQVKIHWMATSATSGNCRWGVQFEKMNTDADSDSFATAAEDHSTTNGTNGIPTTTTITITTIDSLANGDFFRLKIYRDVTDTTNDTMTGDAELIAIELRSVS